MTGPRTMPLQKLVTDTLLALVLLGGGAAPLGCTRAGGPSTNPASPDADSEREATPEHPTAAWVLACQNDDGGFGAFPGDISTVRDTDWALRALEVLGLEVPSPGAVARFLRSWQNEDGGFHGRPWGTRWVGRSTLIDTYHGVAALARLGQEIPRREALVAFVASRQRADGGFFQDGVPDFPFTSATTEQTFYAAAILDHLGAEVTRRREAIGFLRHMQRDQVRGDGGFMYEDIPEWSSLYEAARVWADSVDPYRSPGPEDTRAIPIGVGFTTPTARALAALELLGGEAPDPAGARAFLASQQHASGGFLTGMGDYGAYHDRSEGRMSETYWALRGLRLLVGEAQWAAYLGSAPFDRERLAAYVASCGNPDGGFARRPDPASRPSDMRATAQALQVFAWLGEPAPRPAAPVEPRREVLPPQVELGEASVYFQPDQPGQALYVYRLVGPIRAAHDGDEAAAIAIMEWLNRSFRFGAITPSESGLVLERGVGNCGSLSLALVGLLEAVGLSARFLEVEGHNVVEVLIGGRWQLLDPMFQGAYRRPEGGLSSAFEVHEAHLAGEPEVTDFGDFRYGRYTIYWHRGLEEEEITIGPGDGRGSEAARRGYPDESF